MEQEDKQRADGTAIIDKELVINDSKTNVMIKGNKTGIP